MVFALQGFTKEFIALQKDGIGVEYTGIFHHNFPLLIFTKNVPEIIFNLNSCLNNIISYVCL